jgi:hypothetical protein
MLNKLKYATTLTAIVSALSGTANAQEQAPKEERFRPGLHKLEVSLQDDTYIQGRLFTEWHVRLPGETEAGYWGLNQVTGSTDNYFGRHVFMFGKQKASTKFAVNVKTTQDGISYAQAGIRNYSIPKFLRGVGYLDVTADRESANFILKYVRDIGKGFTAETLHVIGTPFKGTPSFLDEYQLFFDLGKNTSLFAKREGGNRPTVYAAGGAMNFR